MRVVVVRYGNGLVKKFSVEQVRALKKRVMLKNKSELREATRAWAESSNFGYINVVEGHSPRGVR